MQMIVVDDEAHWVDNLSMNKPWYKLGIEQVHRAYSAREALQIVEAYPIDIVISDILMPEMTGLELIEQIRSRDKKIKCIILSGHSDFEFAKKAVQHQAVDYLLKPPSDEELFAAVGAAIAQLHADWDNISSLERTQYTLRENLPLLRGQLLLEALHGHRLSEEEWTRRLGSCELPFHEGDSALLLVRMEDGFGEYAGKDQQLLEYAIMNIAEEIACDHFYVWGVKEEHGYLAVLLQSKGAAEKLIKTDQEALVEKLAMQLEHKVKQFLKGSLSVVMTELFHFPAELPASYQRAAAYFRQIVGDEREFVMRVGDLEQPHGSLEILYMPPALGSLLESGRWEAAEEKVVAVCAELDRHWSESWEHCAEAGFIFTAAFTHLAHRNGHTLTAILGEDMEQLQSGDALTSIAKLRKWSLTVLGKLKENISTEVKDMRSSYVSKIQAYAEANLHQDVSLRALADHVNLHPTHLSKIYKIETGEGISDFVFRLRMERASHLLKATEKKIYEISTEIGYLDPAYFIKVFKRQYGVTPQEFRDHQ
ncbi:response regulator [Paenibacillus sp. GCM10027626]|uniref:response regulator transcription factor n=1 Tax=Paenibacillus sp. GCM10027626 TaxID=3273411 RepID=UPI003643A9C6